MQLYENYAILKRKYKGQMKVVSSKFSQGFALPTVIITSVVMMIVLLTGLSSLSSISTTLDNQRYNQLAREAAQAGVKMAQRCIDLGVINWTDASPLRPGSTCNGSTSSCNSANTCVLYDASTNERTSFTVGPPTNVGLGEYLIQASGSYETRRSGGATVTKSVGSNISVKYTLDNNSVASVSDSGNLLVCAIVKPLGQTKNTVHCWGENKDGRAGVGYFNSGYAACNNASPSITYLVKDSSCAVTAIGEVKRDETSTVGGRSRALLDHEVDVAAGGGFACAISENPGGFTSRRVFCWGSNNKDRLGAGVTIGLPTAGCKNITGSDEQGEQGDTYVACNTPVQVKPQWNIDDSTYYPYDIVAGTAHACVLVKTTDSATATGRVYCWGSRGAEGKLGDGTTGSSSDTPVRVHGIEDASGTLSAKQIGGAGGASMCAINGNDIVACWGSNDFRQLGQGINDTTNRPYPVAVQVQALTDNMTASKVVIQGGIESTSESAHACAIGKYNATHGPNIQTGKIYCWGSNQHGQQGDDGAPGTGAGKAKLVDRIYSTPSDSDVGTPEYIANDIAAANKSFCAIVTIGSGATGDYSALIGTKKVYCAGSHNQGQLGIGPPPNFPVPSPCISGGVAQKTADRVYCDAYTSDSENEPVRSRPLPVDLSNLGDDANNLVSLNGGAVRFCLIAGFTNYCWGRNQVGQIGDGTVKSPRSKPKASAFLNIEGGQIYF